jgi:hypothetical protein
MLQRRHVRSKQIDIRTAEISDERTVNVDTIVNGQNINTSLRAEEVEIERHNLKNNQQS